MRCPICNGRVEAEKVDEFYVCEGCREMLAPSELVKRATPRTRRAYIKRNHPTASRAWLRENGYLK